MEIKNLPTNSVTLHHDGIMLENLNYPFDSNLTGTVIGLVSKSSSFSNIGMTRCFSNDTNIVIETNINNH